MHLRFILVLIFLAWTAGCQVAGNRCAHHQQANSRIARQDADSNESEKAEQQVIRQVSYQDSEEVADRVEQVSELSQVASGSNTLEEIEILAVSLNPAIQKAKAELASLCGKRVQVGLYPNPRAGITGDEINDDGNAGRYGVFYSQQMVRSNRLSLARKTVCAEIEAKETQIAELQQRLLTDVRMAYYGLLVASRKSEVAGELVNVSTQAVEATVSLVEAKEIAVTAQLQAEVELQRAMLNLKRAQNDVAAARRRLAGFIDEADLSLDSIGGSLEPNRRLVDIETRFQQLLDSSPEMHRLFASVKVAKRNLDHQRALGVPDVTWRAGLAYDFGTNDWVPNFQVGMPITKYNRNQGAIAQAKNEIVAGEKAVEQKGLQLRQRMVATYRIYQDARLQVELIADEILPKAKKTLELVSLGYSEGEVGFLDLLTAQRTYFTTNLEYINQLEILWQQTILIEGMMLDQNLDQF